ncbi:MAG: hypothetical protein QOH96_1058 [Blastocatellia bacterium]|nr:hypothetical protein [Blastocatellia bacterium]
MTELTSKQQELRTSEIRYRRLFEAARDGILILDAVTLKITDANPFMTELLGYSRAEFLGKELWEIGFFSDKETSKDSFQKLQETGYLRYDDLPLKSTQGERRQVEFVSNVYKEDGLPVIQCNIRDNTERRGTEDTLRRSQEHLAGVIGSAMDAIITIDEDQRIVLFNSAAEKMFLCATKNAVGQPIENFIPERFRPTHRQHIEDFERTHVTRRTMGDLGAIFGLRTNGEEFPIEASISQVESGGGKIGTVILRDITERKRTEDENAQLTARMESKRQRLKSIIASVPGIVWEAEGVPDSDIRMVFVSDYIESMLGYSVEEWLTTPNFWLSIVHPDDKERAALEAAAGFANRSNCTSEFRWISRDGRAVWVESKFVAITDAKGQPVGVRGVTTDISERKRAEGALRESEERYKGLIDSAFDGVVITKDRIIRSANRAYAEMFGHTVDELVGMDLLQLTSDGEFVRSKLEANEPRYETIGLKKDGTHINVEVSAKACLYEGEPARLSAVRDITERKHLEEQLRQSQKMEAIGRLAGGIAHDFNNLLTVISGYCELTLRRLQPEDAVIPNLEEIRTAAGRAATLTRQLLAFSRKQLLQPKVLDLNALISDLERMLRRLIGEDIDLQTVLKPELSRVNADPGQIEQVIMNLVVNACDAMPDGGRLIIGTENLFITEDYARHHVAVKPGPYVMIAVSDNGSGMNNETKARLFEPFYTTKELGKGTGLGLSTVYGIIKQSMGNIWVYSEVRLGTTFKVYLPAIEEEVDGKPASQSSQPIALGSETILLVEDDKMVRGLSLITLEEAGYRVLQAANGVEALLICEQYPETIHLLLTDVVMPGMSGRAVSDRVKELRPQILVLYMSGYTEDAIVHRGVLNEGINFIEKPFVLAALTRRVREILDAG